MGGCSLLSLPALSTALVQLFHQITRGRLMGVLPVKTVVTGHLFSGSVAVAQNGIMMDRGGNGELPATRRHSLLLESKRP
jgi:hypothetical protein